jgi:glycosyltransferase involved in cell wall biosynthesis
MRVVIDAVPMRGDSLSIVVEHMLEGWLQLESGDDLHLVVGPDPQITIPEGIVVHQVKFTGRGFLGRLKAQSVTIPRLCRSIDADIMLGILPATAITPLPCPRAIIVYDLRYKLRPEGFTRRARLVRRLSYNIGFRQFDSAICISDRTQDDLLQFHPRLRRRPVRTAHLGADHVDSWPVQKPATPYAIAFSHYANKNVDLVIDAWALRRQLGETSLPLTLVGVSDTERPRILKRIEQHGLAGFVDVNPWMPNEQFRATFASSSLVVFASDFEGFGLPAAEAMRLSIPVVITPDLALLEVTAGHATVMENHTPEALVRSVDVAQGVTADDLAAARLYADRYTWRNFAFRTRWLLAETVAGVAAPARPPKVRPVLAPAGAGVAWGRRVLPALFRRPGASAHPGRFRWIGAAVASTLAISGISAASIALVDANRTPTPHVATTTTASTPPSQQSPGQGFVPLPTVSTTVPAGAAPSTTSSGEGVSTTSTRPGASSTPSSAVSGLTLPSVTVPAVTIPSITIPTLPPLSSLLCSVGATTKTAPISLPTLPCTLTVTSQVTVCRCS